MARSTYQSALGAKKKSSSISNSIPAKRQKKESGWADGLKHFLEDPSDPAVVYSDDEFIAIRDKYPKSKAHFLVMPRDTKYGSLKDLKDEDVELLRKMESVANKVVHDNNENGDPSLKFRYGFHAVPSMNHLHMHVISQDFDSSCLKNKKHWNSFTTTFFVPIDEVKEALGKGCVDFSYRESRLKDGLKCHRCAKHQTNMPQLKQHIAQCDFDATVKEDDDYDDY